MSKIKLNPAQEEFVSVLNKNILVSASAGSGKTTTMITKIIKLVSEHKVPLKNLLIVTYTNSAASELKVKIYNKLVEKINTSDNDEDIRFLSQQLDEINTCEIGTLHSVCKKIIKKYFYAIEQDSNFSLLSEKDISYYFGQATNNVFKKLISENNVNFYNLYTAFNTKRSFSALSDVVEKIYTFLCSKVVKQDWINYVVNSVYDLNIDKNICVEYLLTKFKNIFFEIKKQFQFLYDRSLKLDAKFTKFIECRLNFCNQISYSNNLAEFSSLVNEASFLSKPRVSTKTTLDEKEWLTDCEEVLSEFSYEFGCAKQFVKLINVDQLKQVKYLITNLFDVVKLVKEEYDKIKSEKYVLDFNDLEEKTLEILKNEDICSELRENYKYVFVDEYQDINEIQETIILKLAKENNLNLIGDVKQSIYEFRLSNPKLFLEKYEKYGHNINGKLINLNENYRSEENILIFVNFIFNELITEKTLGINYKQHSQLVKGGSLTGNKVVSLDIINSKAEGDDVNETEDIQNDEAEALLIVQKVIDLVGKEYYVGDKKCNLEYKDIAILLRSKKELSMQVYKKLNELNIPCDASFRTEIFKTAEVNQLLSILQVLSNHHNDLACATLLKSKIFNLNENHLVKIREISDKTYFYECINDYEKLGSDENILKVLKEFKEFIKKYQFFLINHSVLDTLKQIMEDYSLMQYYFSLPDGGEKVANINQFLALLNNPDFAFNLTKCLEFLNKTSKSSVLIENEVENVNAVRIMTIHSSKGLEFPAVIVGGLGKSFLINKFTNNIIINDKFGVGVKFLDGVERVENETLVRLACKYANKKTYLDEEMRLLYVALTRAKNYLSCVGTYDVKKAVKNKQKDVYFSSNYLDLMFKSFSNDDLYALQNKETFVINANTDSQCTVTMHNKFNIEKPEKVTSNIILTEGNKELVETLRELHNFKYPFENSKNVPIKNSVSSILKETNDYENVVYAPKKLLLLESAVNSESLLLGTMYHEVMEKINYTESEAEITNLVNLIKQKPEYENVKDLLKLTEVLNCVENIKQLTENGKVYKEIMFSMKDKHSNLVEGGVDESVIVQGVIDLVVEKENEVIIVDFKTNKFFKDEDLINTYSTQLSLYAKAFEKAFNKKVNKLLLYSFSKNKFIEIPKKVII